MKRQTHLKNVLLKRSLKLYPWDSTTPAFLCLLPCPWFHTWPYHLFHTQIFPLWCSITQRAAAWSWTRDTSKTSFLYKLATLAISLTFSKVNEHTVFWVSVCVCVLNFVEWSDFSFLVWCHGLHLNWSLDGVEIIFILRFSGNPPKARLSEQMV